MMSLGAALSAWRRERALRCAIVPGPTGGRLCFIERQAPPQRRRRRKGAAAPYHPLHQCHADVERLTDLEHARAALLEAQDALYSNPAPA